MIFRYGRHDDRPDAIGTIIGAGLRCPAMVGYDEEEDLPLRCGATRHAHAVGPRPCGHEDPEERVLVGEMDGTGARAEIEFDKYTDQRQWSRFLLRMGL